MAHAYVKDLTAWTASTANTWTRSVSTFFDYCGNFEFFREQKNDADEKPVASLSERIFSRKTELVHALQSSEFTSDENLMAWRDELVNDIHGQVASLDESKVSVRLRREYVEKYRNIKKRSNI